MDGFLIPLGLTLLIEVPVAAAWGLRRRDLLLCVLVNVLTNPAANLLHLLFPALWVTAAIEAAAVLTEGACYRLCGDGVGRPMLLSLSANLLSFSVGIILWEVIL